MDNDDTTRAEAVNDLERAIGARSAMCIMSRLPVVDWTQPATKADLEPLATKAELRVLAAELRSEIADLRGDLRTGLADVRGDLRAEIRDQGISQIRWFVTTNTTLAAVIITAFQLLK